MVIGGEGGIRTHGRRKPTTVFETATIDHSVTSPRFRGHLCGAVDSGASDNAQGAIGTNPLRLRGVITGSCGRETWQLGVERLALEASFPEGPPMRLPRLALAALLALGQPALAETPAVDPAVEVSIDRVAEVMRLGDLFQVLREEGISHGEELQADMFPSGSDADWTAEVSAIYDLEHLQGEFTSTLNAALSKDPKTLEPILTFFGSDLGQRILGLEIDARRAFLDSAAEEAARVAADDAAASREPKAALIRRMIEAGDLLEMNVAGSLSGSLAFMTGMADSGAYGALPQDQLLSDVWGQEEQVRADTSSWLNAYLGLAYHPLTEAELESYVVFWESPAGQKLNAALFSAFDQVFRQVSLDLGRAAGRAMQGSDI